MWVHILRAAIALPVATFFAFVGWHKAFSPVAELVRHGAYTIHLPEWLGRLAGFTEMACAIALAAGVVPRWHNAAKWGAAYVFISQIWAGTIHILHGEIRSLPGNAQWMAMAAVLFALCVRSPRLALRDEEPA